MKMPAAIVAFFLVIGALVDATSADQNTPAPPAATQSAPRPINDILVAQPFTLQRGYRNTWSKDRADVSSGLLVVLDVDPALAARRDALEPILYAGDTPVQRLNDGGQSGRVIGILPGVTTLTGVPIWFGAPGLPERVTSESARSERAQAEKAGIRPFSDEKLRSVTRAPAAATDLAALLRDQAAALVLQYSPQEKDLADAWRLPAAKPK